MFRLVLRLLLRLLVFGKVGADVKLEKEHHQNGNVDVVDQHRGETGTLETLELEVGQSDEITGEELHQLQLGDDALERRLDG